MELRNSLVIKIHLHPFTTQDMSSYMCYIRYLLLPRAMTTLENPARTRCNRCCAAAMKHRRSWPANCSTVCWKVKSCNLVEISSRFAKFCQGPKLHWKHGAQCDKGDNEECLAVHFLSKWPERHWKATYSFDLCLSVAPKPKRSEKFGDVSVWPGLMWLTEDFAAGRSCQLARLRGNPPRSSFRQTVKKSKTPPDSSHGFKLILERKSSAG